MGLVLLPLPALDFDPTEVAVSWSVLTGRGHEVIFATPDGRPGRADDLMITGRGLDPWGAVPLLRNITLIGRALRANADGRRAYVALQRDRSFTTPLSWREARASDFDGIVLPGGHRARGMREYLESELVQELVVQFFAAGQPVGAVCHGVLAAARSVDPATGRSVLHGRRTTALTWQLERTAWTIARRSRFWDPDYYRTYTEEPGQEAGAMSVQHEVTRALARAEDFLDVPLGAPDYRLKTSGRARDTMDDARPAWVVRDGNYVSARWPGDVHTFARTFSEALAGMPS
ncbi:MAG: type 1 glutamine amidotransferase domain-containing protein [Acidimicrobiales bacterium]